MSAPQQRKFKKAKNRKNKIHLVFDEEKRKDFLTGFHKRKLQRKKVAQEKLEQQLKEERKRLKQEAKESYKKLVVSNRDIPGLEHLLEDQYEDEDVTVKITELSTDAIAKQNNWIGSNVPKYEKDESSDEQSAGEEEEEGLPGMDLKRKPVKKEKEEKPKPEFKTHKEIKKTLKKQATKNVKKSAVFQRKNKIERQKQKKKSLQKKKEKIRLSKKVNKKRGIRGHREPQD